MMTRRAVSWIGLECLLVAGMATAADAVVLLPQGVQRISARAEADGLVDQQQSNAPLGVASWTDSIHPSVLGPVSRADAIASINMSRSSSSLTGNGLASGVVAGLASSEATSVVETWFRVEECESYNYFASVGSAGANVGSGEFVFALWDDAGVNDEELALVRVNGGGQQQVVLDSGQLSAGLYLVRGQSFSNQVTSSGAYTAPQYLYSVGFSDCLVALINQQPVDRTVEPGDTASLSVVAASFVGTAANGAEGPAGAGGFTYQWRHAGADLVDDGRITGSTTSTLSISNCGEADAGGYVVQVSDGSTQQTSSLAVLTVPEPSRAVGMAVGAAALLGAGRLRRASGRKTEGTDDPASE